MRKHLCDPLCDFLCSVAGKKDEKGVGTAYKGLATRAEESAGDHILSQNCSLSKAHLQLLRENCAYKLSFILTAIESLNKNRWIVDDSSANVTWRFELA